MSNFQHRFIELYTQAHSLGLHVDQLSAHMGLKPNTIKRYVYMVKDTMGISLPPLSSTIMPDPYTLGDVTNVKKSPTVNMFTGKPHRYIITTAQNATPVDDNFFKCLTTYATLTNSQILVIGTRYKNPTSVWSASQEGEEWWDKRIVPYLVTENKQLSPSLMVIADIKIQPTATNPLSGFDTYTGVMSGVFGHPKIQLKTIPTPNQNLPKILTTTGAITGKNYTDSKAGKKGEFHHSLGACIVEVDYDGITHIRHVHANTDGSFYDLDKYITTKGVTEYNRIAGLVCGDIHAEFIDPSVEAGTFSDANSICNVLRPEVIVYHDVEDFYRRNHHHKGNHLLAFAKHHLGRNNVEEGLQITADFIDKHTRPDCTNIIVKSNHDEALNRWLREADPKQDPENAILYHYLMYHTLSNVKPTSTGFSFLDPFAFWCKNPVKQKGMLNDSTLFLGRDESFTIKDIEVGFHGDQGPNGSRGSIKSFTKIGPKTVIGHSHTPGIEEGVYQVGVSARLDLEYVSGPSSWLQTHCVIYPDGKRTLIHLINGKWKI